MPLPVGTNIRSRPSATSFMRFTIGFLKPMMSILTMLPRRYRHKVVGASMVSIFRMQSCGKCILQMLLVNLASWYDSLLVDSTLILSDEIHQNGFDILCGWLLEV